MEVYFVYGLVILFFIGMVGIVAFVIIPNNQQMAVQSQESARAQLEGKQNNNILNYGIVAVLFLLLIAFTFVAKRAQPVS